MVDLPGNLLGNLVDLLLPPYTQIVAQHLKTRLSRHSIALCSEPSLLTLDRYPLIPDFVDRGDILDQIHQRCSEPAGRAALVGLGGIGYAPTVKCWNDADVG
jgi:hypothetical protein